MIGLRSVAAVLRHMILVVGFVVLSSALAHAQFDSGTITGRVTDPSGAAVAHATVTVTNVATSFQKVVKTDSGGDFTVSALPSGNYVVSAATSGFAEAKSQTIALNVGATVRVNLALTLQVIEEKIEITGTATTVDTSSSTAGTTLNANQISNLPINGRDLMDFLEIAPGSVGSTGIFQGSVNGQENFFTGLNVTVDGQNATRGDVNGFSETEGNEQARLTRASVDSVQEINFANSGYSAEVGHSLGPQMNIVTKGGTNDFHGTLFEFFRNDVLDANDYFANSLTAPKQPLRMNQFGGNLGGPIIKKKLFFFFNYEGIRQRTTAINSLYEVPSAYVRSLFVPAMQPVLAQMAPLPAACTAIPAPASCAVPNTIDTGNPAGGADLVYDPAALPTTLSENSGSIRLDYNLSDNDRVFFRYNIDDSLTDQTIGLNEGQVTPLYLRTQLGKLDETHTFSSTLLNEFSVAINRFYSDTNSNTPTPLTGFSGFFTNLGALPGPNTFNQVTPFTVFEVFDNVTKVVGTHTLRFGTQIRANRLNEFLRPTQTFEFGSFSDLENDRPFDLQKIGFPGFVGVRNSNWDFYVQDDWKVNRKLTLNLGLRYDYNTVWREGHNEQENFDFATQSFLPATQAPYHAPGKDFAPRIGLAYDPFGHGKTVIHAYGGMFYNPMHFGFGLVGNLPAYESYNVNVFQAPLVYPEANPPLPAGTQNVSIFPEHPKDPYSINWLLGIQQEIAPNTVLTVNYTGNEDHHMQAGVDFSALNLNPANVLTQSGRPFSGFANESLDADVLNSSYNALQVQVRHTTHRLTFEANYTWSHEIDDMVNVFGGFSDPYDPSLDRGSGDWDIRHNVTGSVLYSLPNLTNFNSLARKVLGGWQTANIVQARTGGPVNPQLESGFFGIPVRPDLTGQPIKLSNSSWPNPIYNINAFEVDPNFDGDPGVGLGDAGRNSLRAPGFFQWDFALMKNFPVREKFTVQFRVDVFNILNHPNFANPDVGICTAVTVPITTPAPGCALQPTPTNPNQEAFNPNFGRVGQTIASANNSLVGTGTARQEQFSLKIIF
jgi:Carboxypeptidase regulatory-like domain/TonB dependent receptor